MTSTVDPRAGAPDRAPSSGGRGPGRLARAVSARRTAAPESADPKLGALVTRATKDVSDLLRGEVALAKAEVRHDVKEAATGGGLFGAAALFGLFTLMMLSGAAVYGIHATGLSLAWCWLIVGGAYLLITLFTAGLGLWHVKHLRGARSTKRSAEASIAVLKRTH